MAILKARSLRISYYLKALFRVCLFTVIVIVYETSMAQTLAIPSKDQQLKAIFLFNFTQFVEWPSNAFSKPNTPLVIGVLGSNSFGSYLEEAVTYEKVNGHPVIVKHYLKAEDVENCHILYINLKTVADTRNALSSLKSQNILTVGEVSGFTQLGGVIQFLNRNNKIRLRINVDNSSDANLIISSKLLRLAETVKNN